MADEDKEEIYLPLTDFVNGKEKDNFYSIIDIVPYLSGLESIELNLGSIKTPLEFIEWLEQNCIDIWHFWKEGEAFYCEGFYLNPVLHDEARVTYEEETTPYEIYTPPHTINPLPEGFYTADSTLYGDEEYSTTGYVVEPERVGSDTWFVSCTPDIQENFSTTDYKIIKKTHISNLYLDKETTKAILRPPIFNKMLTNMGKKIEKEEFFINTRQMAKTKRGRHNQTVPSQKTINKQNELIAVMAQMIIGKTNASKSARAERLVDDIQKKATELGWEVPTIDPKTLKKYIEEGEEILKQ